MMSVATCIPDSVSLSLSCLSEGDLTVVENVLTGTAQREGLGGL